MDLKTVSKLEFVTYGLLEKNQGDQAFKVWYLIFEKVPSLQLPF